MPKVIHVINPNSNASVTAELDAAVESLRMAGGPEVVCSTLSDGPPGVETQYDVDRAALAVREFALSKKNDAAAFVVACFSDPGLHLLREGASVPALGISECSVLTALSMGQTFGVIGLHLRHAFGDLGDARIARRAEQPVAQRRLPHFPGQGVLAPSRSDQQDIHGRGMTAPAPMVKARRGYGVV